MKDRRDFDTVNDHVDDLDESDRYRFGGVDVGQFGCGWAMLIVCLIILIKVIANIFSTGSNWLIFAILPAGLIVTYFFGHAQISVTIDVLKTRCKKKLREYYINNYGENEADVWYEQPAVNVWVFRRDDKIITLKSHLLTGEVTEKIEQGE